MRNKKKKYVVKFMVEQQGIYNKIAKRKLNPLNEAVRFKKRTYLIDITKPTYTEGLTLFFLIDIKGKFIKLKKKEKNTKKEQKEIKKDSLITEVMEYDPEVADSVFFKKIVKQLTSSLNTNALTMNIIAIIIGIAIGGPIGWILGGMS